MKLKSLNKSSAFCVTVFLFLIVALFSSCNNFNDNSKDKKIGYVKIGSVCAKARTALPVLDEDSIEDFSFVFEYKGNDAALTFSELGTFDSLTALKAAHFAVESGEWIFKLTASKGGTVLSDVTAAVTVSSTVDTTISFNLKWDSSNLSESGNLEFTLDFSNAPTKGEVQLVTGQLYSYDPSTATETALTDSKYLENELDFTGSTVTYSFTGADTLEAGCYRIKIRLYADTEKNKLINTVPELAVISGGQTSSGTYELQSLNNVYSVNWANIEGIDSTVAPEIYTKFSGISSFPSVTKVGYTFDGWYEQPDFSGTAKTSVSAGTTGNIVFYAKWNKKSYTVSFNTLGGSSVTSQTVLYQELASKPANPTKTAGAIAAYEFKNWYTSEDEGTTLSSTPFDFENTPVTANITLYADWYSLSTGITVTINPSSDISLTYETSGTSVIFTAAGGDSYSWFVNDAKQDGETGSTFTLSAIYGGVNTYVVEAVSGMHSATATVVLEKKFGTKLKPDAVGDIVFVDGSATPYSAGLTLTAEQKAAAIAVIFYVGTECSNKGDEHVLGAGLKLNNEKNIAWCTEDAKAHSTEITTIECNVQGTSWEFVSNPDKDGSDNLGQIGNALGSNKDTSSEYRYPAFYWANNYSDIATVLKGTAYESHWYLPSAYEMYMLASNNESLKDARSLCGGDLFMSEDNWYYWTSSQMPNEDDRAGLIWFKTEENSFGLSNVSKKSLYRVCAIRQFN